MAEANSTSSLTSARGQPASQPTGQPAGQPAQVPGMLLAAARKQLRYATAYIFIIHILYSVFQKKKDAPTSFPNFDVHTRMLISSLLSIYSMKKKKRKNWKYQHHILRALK